MEYHLPIARRVVPYGTWIEIFSIRLSIINMAAFRGGLCCGTISTHPQDRFERDAPLVWVPYPEGLFFAQKKDGQTVRPLADSSPAISTSGRVQNAFNRRPHVLCRPVYRRQSCPCPLLYHYSCRLLLRIILSAI